MIIKRISYRVTPGLETENEQAVAQFIDEAKSVAGASYTSYRLGDSNEFFHIAIFQTPDAKDAFFALDSFKPFADGLQQRAIEGPNVEDLSLVGKT